MQCSRSGWQDPDEDSHHPGPLQVLPRTPAKSGTAQHTSAPLLGQPAALRAACMLIKEVSVAV